LAPGSLNLTDVPCQVHCHLCGVSFNIGRIRRADEPKEAAWGGEYSHYPGTFVDHRQSSRYGRCGPETGCCLAVRTPEGQKEPEEAGVEEVNEEEDNDEEDDSTYEYQSGEETEVYEYCSDDSTGALKRQNIIMNASNLDEEDGKFAGSPISYSNWSTRVRWPLFMLILTLIRISSFLYAWYGRCMSSASSLMKTWGLDLYEISEGALLPEVPKQGKTTGSDVFIPIPQFDEQLKDIFFESWDTEPHHEHIAGPGCLEDRGYRGSEISIEEMKGCTTVQCLVRKNDNWTPEPDDEDFELQSDFFLSGLSDHMPSRDMRSPTVTPARHGLAEPNADTCVWDVGASPTGPALVPFPRSPYPLADTHFPNPTS